MKKLLLFLSCLFAFILSGISQHSSSAADVVRVVLDNDKMTVTEYTSSPGKDMCGSGKHSHPPHLSIFLTDANPKLSIEEGKWENLTMKAGTVLWSDGDTHRVINGGNQTATAYVVVLKQPK